LCCCRAAVSPHEHEQPRQEPGPPGDHALAGTVTFTVSLSGPAEQPAGPSTYSRRSGLPPQPRYQMECATNTSSFQIWQFGTAPSPLAPCHRAARNRPSVRWLGHWQLCPWSHCVASTSCTVCTNCVHGRQDIGSRQIGYVLCQQGRSPSVITSGSLNRLLGPDPVRHMSVSSGPFEHVTMACGGQCRLVEYALVQ
jgi:hypothetical protein